jgi:hypothetical protein
MIVCGWRGATAPAGHAAFVADWRGRGIANVRLMASLPERLMPSSVAVVGRGAAAKAV